LFLNDLSKELNHTQHYLVTLVLHMMSKNLFEMWNYRYDLCVKY